METGCKALEPQPAERAGADHPEHGRRGGPPLSFLAIRVCMCVYIYICIHIYIYIYIHMNIIATFAQSTVPINILC